VDLKEIEEANMKSPDRVRASVMHDIEKKKDVTFPGQIKLLNQSLSEGRKYWIRQPERYVEELHNAILLDYEMLRIIHDLTQHDETTSFKDKFDIIRNKEIPQANFAKALLNIGFNVRTRTIVKDDDDENPVTEFTHIFQTSDLPIPIILKTLLATVKGLPDEYVYEVVKDELSFVQVEEEIIVEDLTLPLVSFPSPDNT